RTAVLALGANLADPIVTLRRAVADLDKVEGITVRQVSPLVRSAAVLEKDQQGQPDYLDAVLQVETSLAPLELLHECN
ncbi:2-amino-4-hydroxy-6-hydroxymethyldihydropteridine diphosphokinase, partial [Streptococcus agalactiae]